MSDRLSLSVSLVLDRMGYNEELRQYRIQEYGDVNFVARLCSDRQNFQLLLAGSKAEGTSKFYESDFDSLHIYTGVRATECEDITEDDHELTLYMENDTVPPGYCKLQLLQCGRNNFHHQIFFHNDCYVRCPGYWRPHLSSTFVLHSEHQYMPHDCEISGPANKGQELGVREMDTVYAIRCSHMPNSFKSWLKRHKQCKHPTRQILEQIARNDVYLVPVGKHGSEHRLLEWRISFNMAEKILIHNFSAVQYKVYILLKMFVKEVLQPQCPGSITSYIVKTLMLWAVEQLFSELWRTENLVYIFSVMVLRLYSCVQSGFCPMYFIPQDNILQGRMKKETQEYICNRIAALLSDRRPCILRIPSLVKHIYNYMYAHVPVSLNDELEKAEILLNHVRKIHGISLLTTDRDNFFCCTADEQISYNELLTDLVSARLSSKPERKGNVKYQLGQVLSGLALQQYTCISTNQNNNSITYSTLRQCTKLLRSKCGCQGLCGRVDLAQILYMLGQYEDALDVLAAAAESIRYYMKKISSRSVIQSRKPHHRLINSLRNGCLSTTMMLKHFSIPDQQYDRMVEPCLPQALKYEVHSPCDKRKKSVRSDLEIVLYYLQYLCYEQLGRRRRAHVAFAKLIWSATRCGSNIEYKEVALNILGHCLLKKGLYGHAAKALVKSVMWSLFLHKQFPLKPDLDKNSAIWHIAILLNKLDSSAK